MNSEFEGPRIEDRLAIRALVDAWAHFADRRMPDDQAGLFTPDGQVSVFSDALAREPTDVLKGQAMLAEAFTVLDTYETTTHLNGQSTVEFQGDVAHGELYCLAYHVWMDQGRRTLMTMSIRYLDTYVLQAGGWRFSERRLFTDWIDRRVVE